MVEFGGDKEFKKEDIIFKNKTIPGRLVGSVVRVQCSYDQGSRFDSHMGP